STVLGTGIINGAGQSSFSTSALAVGTHAITASYSGNSGFLPAISAPTSVVVTAANVVLTTDRSNLTIESEHHGGLNVSLASIGGLSGPFTFACGPLPAWATCRFGSPTLLLQANGTVTTSLEIDTDAVYHFKSALQLPSQPSSKLPLLALTPLAWCAFSFRRRQASILRKRLLGLAAPMILLALACSIIGCGDKYPDHTDPGSYTVQVTANSAPGSTPVAITRVTTFLLVVTH
ncbi:MAG: Ig-like domain-containing protein, partial [Janthinobacterium lividum]